MGTSHFRIKEREAKKLSLLKCLAKKNGGADQELLRVIVLSSVEYGCNVYGAA
jgi:hypothetical protein